jgi:hypothetical protein
VQRHLQIMHRLYNESKWTVVILANEMPDTMLSALSLVRDKGNQRWNGSPQFEDWPHELDMSLFDNFMKARSRQ